MLAVALEATLEVWKERRGGGGGGGGGGEREAAALYGVVLSHNNVEYHIHTIFRFVHAAHTRSSADDASDAQ